MSSSSSVYDAKPWVRFYPDGVPTELEVPVIPLTHLLDDAAANFPRHRAVAFFGRTLTYRQLRHSVDRFAVALRRLGVRKGDRVALVLPNCPQQVIAFYGSLRLGAIVVQHNPLYTAAELHHQLVDSGAKVVVVFDRVYATLVEALPGAEIEQVIVTSLVEYLPAVKRLALRLPLRRAQELREELITEVPADADVLFFGDLLKRSRGTVRQAPISPARDLALLQYTGGTTGRPKGAMLTHRNLVANAYQTSAWDPGSRVGHDVTLAVLPLFHAFGLTLCLTTTVLLGGTIVLLPKFDLDMVFEAVDKYKPTIFPGVPPIYSQMISSGEADSHRLDSIRTCVSGATKLPRDIVDSFQKASGGRVVQGYGLTETSPVVLCNPLDGNARHVTVGIPVSSTEARVVDENDPDQLKPVGEAGELLVRGPQSFKGYWNQPDESADVLRDGWVRTGDIALMSPDGYFTIIDRKRDVIMVSGFSVFPSEIEDVIREHPAVEDCAVVGVPDAYRGENVKAFVIPATERVLSAEELRQYCAQRLVAYKVPRLIETREELPRNMLGKVLRRVLREESGPNPLSNL
ncbi:MAG: AMP-binding protein [Streptosporangiaceae bacterium]